MGEVGYYEYLRPCKWRESSGKDVLTLHSCISVMDQAKINEQNKSNRYRTPLRINQIRSELNVAAERYGGFELQGVSDVATLARG